MNKTRIKELQTFFLDSFEEFHDFSDAGESYRQAEDNYKREAISIFQSLLGDWIRSDIGSMNCADVLGAIKKCLLDKLPVDGKKQNFTSWRDDAYLFDELLQSESNQNQFIKYLHGLLQDAVNDRSVDESLGTLLVFLNTQNCPANMSRIIPTLFLFFTRPDKFIYMKPTAWNKFCILIEEEKLKKGAFFTIDYLHKMLSIAESVKSGIAEWRSRDMVDVQSFIFCTHDYTQATDAESDLIAEEQSIHEPGVEDKNMKKVSGVTCLNKILYGPPGTGKTYNTVIEAVRICEPSFRGNYQEAKVRYKKLQQEGRIEFVTFHQSYGYEEFVEGIRPMMSENGAIADSINYEIKKGVFKKICYDAKNDVADARVVSEKESQKYGISTESRVFKISIDGTGESATRKYCFEHDEARIGWGESGSIGNPANSEQTQYFNTLSSPNKNTLQTFKDIQPGDVLLCIASSNNVSGIGVVSGEYHYDTSIIEGVHKDYNHVLPTTWCVKGEQLPFKSINDGVRFVQKTVYPLHRIAPEIIVKELVNLSHSAVVDFDARHMQPYVLIIDEINRGNISKVFGELITLIEDDKRIGAEHEMTVRLPVSGEEFGVPMNLHIIGTMNTADRSIAMMDTALRRRFEFIEKMPDTKVFDEFTDDEFIKIENGKKSFELNLKKMLKTINDRIEVLYDREHTIGHAFFMGLKNDASISKLASIFKNKIIPLLAEYFFEDWEKIRMVLGDDQKDSEDFQFITMENGDKNKLFGSSASEFIDWQNHKTYKRNDEALYKPESYIGIYPKNESSSSAESDNQSDA